ncbi:hypothetical protein GRZ55_22130 [Chelativorans sp. ZYF759]|nr:hypothetical protein [Chelativorans sp. ZYF759]
MTTIRSSSRSGAVRAVPVNLAYPTGLIVSPAAVEQHGENYGRNPVDIGPFRFAE